MVIFFKQKTAYEMRISNWSSDVCSSDLQDRRGDTSHRSGFPDVRLHGLRNLVVDRLFLAHAAFRTGAAVLGIRVLRIGQVVRDGHAGILLAVARLTGVRNRLCRTHPPPVGLEAPGIVRDPVATTLDSNLCPYLAL